MSTSIVPDFARFAAGRAAPALALELRDELMRSRSLLDDFDAAGAVALTRDLYWLMLVGAALVTRPARFVAIARAEIFDALLDAVDYARSVAPAGAWYRAVETAYGWLLEQDVLHFDALLGALRVPSATRPGVTYTANGSCQCEQFELAGGACFHRAAARLVVRALEARPSCELCEAPAVLIGEQWVCVECSPVAAAA